MLRHLRGAAPDPREVDVATAADEYSCGSATFVDVRESDEWAEGHMPGALHVPLGELAARMEEIPSDKPVIAVCHLGQRSLIAADILKAAGHEHPRSLAGGMIDWTKAGHPVE